MRILRRGNERGFSLVEALIALTLGGAFMATALGVWYFSTKSWKTESVRANLRVDIEQAMGRIKEDVRLSDYNGILYYPSTAVSYTAISIPHATPDSTTKLLTLSSSQISWDKAIIYHVYNNSGTYELRRTEMTYNSSAATRQTSLNTLAAAGTIAGGTTRTLFKCTTATLEITPQNPTFDGYSGSTTRSNNTDFGSVTLSSGTHLVRFEITGQNTSSSGRAMGIDSIMLSPSGGGQREAEALTATSGSALSNENMTAYTGSLWGGNYQKACASSLVGDYVSFSVDYDQWLESNFDSMTHSNTEVTGSNPALIVASRETQGLSADWKASTQTAGTQGSVTLGTTQTLRTVIQGASITRSADMIRIKFTAPAGGTLQINSAYFGARSGSTENFSGSTTRLYFDNPSVAGGGTDGVGAVGTGTATSATVSAGSYVWSNWFVYTLTAPVASDYLVSMNASSGSAGETWTDTSGSPATHCYHKNDTTAGAELLTVWASDTPETYAFGSVEMAGWQKTGTATSQIYDTKITTPAFTTLSWTPSLPTGATATFKFRSSASASMSGATDWSVLTDRTTSPSTLATGLRYVQFQTTLTAASPYTTYPSVDDVSIKWPGATALVELSGYYTKKSNYGIFKVLVDGQPTVQGLQIKLTASKDYRGTTYSCALNSECKPRNTGK